MWEMWGDVGRYEPPESRVCTCVPEPTFMYHAASVYLAAHLRNVSSAASRSAWARVCASGSLDRTSTITPARSMSVSSSPGRGRGAETAPSLGSEAAVWEARWEARRTAANTRCKSRRASECAATPCARGAPTGKGPREGCPQGCPQGPLRARECARLELAVEQPRAYSRALSCETSLRIKTCRSSGGAPLASYTAYCTQSGRVSGDA